MPFVGYVRPSGTRGTRMDPGGKYNTGNITKIREFFQFMRDVPRTLLNDQLVLTPKNFDRDHAFDDILFETDESERTVFQRFLRLGRPKSLVIPHLDHLFDARNPLIEEFAKDALRSYIPIISLSDDEVPLTPAQMRLWGDQLPFKIMENQSNVHNSIEARFAKFGVKF
ncbi:MULTISPECIES: hypothetical protein [unclassified Bradyrhizobium]|uniref:hypothetical protein n=1 Tax=unclassified Bradyrhizobium TaxID=2631580 RepID=UPI002FF04517